MSFPSRNRRIVANCIINCPTLLRNVSSPSRMPCSQRLSRQSSLSCPFASRRICPMATVRCSQGYSCASSLAALNMLFIIFHSQSSRKTAPFFLRESISLSKQKKKGGQSTSRLPQDSKVSKGTKRCNLFCKGATFSLQALKGGVTGKKRRKPYGVNWYVCKKAWQVWLWSALDAPIPIYSNNSPQTHINVPLIIMDSSSSSSSDSQEYRRIYQKQLKKHAKPRSRSRDTLTVRWHLYEALPLDFLPRLPKAIALLPIYRKQQEILSLMVANQVLLITGETGCGKSTQVPRMLYEYLVRANLPEKVLCVQPRRLAVLNLKEMLAKQIPQQGVVGYQIGMEASQPGRISFVTNGIFLQRLVHNADFLNEYAFLVLDEVHERDIDTDFILLAVKRLLRRFPRLRLLLMSATLDSDLFRYYFAQDHIDRSERNYYRRLLESKGDPAGEELLFMKSNRPCPVVNVTEPGQFTRSYFYLDNLPIQWAKTAFYNKYPVLNKELHHVVCGLLESVPSNVVLVFLPGLAEIEALSEDIKRHFKQNPFQIFHVHSTVLNQDLLNHLHTTGMRRIILATNIAQSSITVMGVDLVIDFCLCKEVHFDVKSRMENLELVWASKASCAQRAGRTGRVCNGSVFRLVEKEFFDRLPPYSTPQIQRSSLEKVILRIKLIHEKESTPTFQDPGEVLGSAIQPPQLKNIDSSINSLLFYGGLQRKGDLFQLTALGRFYVSLPIDICYARALLTSLLFNTYEDVLVLVAMLSQNKNPFRRNLIFDHPLTYYQMMDSPFACDYYALVMAYWRRFNSHNRDLIPLDVFYQAKHLAHQLDRRIKHHDLTKNVVPLLSSLPSSLPFPSPKEERFFWFQLTLTCSFIDKILRVRQPLYDDKQEKRIKAMRGIQSTNTLCLLNCPSLRKPEEGEQALVAQWANRISKTFHVEGAHFTLTQGVNYLHFKNERDLKKVLFLKHWGVQLADLGETDFLQHGQPTTFQGGQQVQIDQGSLNRVTPVQQQHRFLVSNCLLQQKGRLFSHFSSLLPPHPHYEVIVHLLFYPFVQLETNKEGTFYERLRLRRKNFVPLSYWISREEIIALNAIRKALKDFYSGEAVPAIPLHEFIHRQRTPLTREGRWQELYLVQIKQRNIPPQLLALLATRSPAPREKAEEKTFMNPIAQVALGCDYFFSPQMKGWSLEARLSDYTKWKQEKLLQINKLEETALSHQHYLVCGECKLPLAKLQKVGPLTRDGGRELFQTEVNVMEVPFNEVDSFFCNMLLEQGIQSPVQGCRNGHAFGVRAEKRVKIFPFSQLGVQLADGSAFKYNFQRLEIRYWKPAGQKAIQDKMHRRVNAYCFLCHDTFLSMRELAAHLKDQLHAINYKDFKRCVSS